MLVFIYNYNYYPTCEGPSCSTIQAIIAGFLGTELTWAVWDHFHRGCPWEHRHVGFCQVAEPLNNFLSLHWLSLKLFMGIRAEMLEGVTVLSGRVF